MVSYTAWTESSEHSTNECAENYDAGQTYIATSTNINPDGSGNDLRNGLFTSGYLAYGLAYNDSFYRIFCVRSDCGGDLNADNSKDGAFFTMGAWVSGAGNAIGVNARGAIFYENDRTNPTVPTHTTSTDLSGWKNSGTVTTGVGGRDPGMGTKVVGEGYINRSGALAATTYTSGCDGSSATPCNADLAQTLSTSIDDMPEGANQLQSYATDVLGKTGTGSAFTVKVDRTAPTGTLAAPPEFAKGSVTFSGTISDDLSGPARWVLETKADNSTSWQSVCTASQASADGSWSFDHHRLGHGRRSRSHRRLTGRCL